ncbi:acyltransferase [Thermodesulfobacteriota bacterium]
MDINDNVELNDDLKKLWKSLKDLHQILREKTYERYQRINPFYEDLFEWKERGRYWTKNNNNVTIYNSTTMVGKVEIGENTWIGPFCSLDGNGGLKIGRYCSISLGCQLLTHDTVKWALSAGKAEYEYAKTTINDCCFLGSYTVVNKGVTIGKHCVIGAGSVVTKDIPDYTIAAGVPTNSIGRVEIDENNKVILKYFK